MKEYPTLTASADWLQGMAGFLPAAKEGETICMGAKKNPNAVALGKLGGIARASSLTKAERSAIADLATKWQRTG